MDTPSKGEYSLNSQSPTTLGFFERARIRNRYIGFNFQSFNLIGGLTVADKVDLPLTYRGIPSSERKDRVATILEKVEMSQCMKHYPSQFLGG